MVLEISKKSKIAFGTFSYLRENLPNTSPYTLRHICAYIARCYDEFDINKDLKLSFTNKANTICQLTLSNGSEITFCNFGSNSLDFIIEKGNDELISTTFVSTQDHNSLSTAYAHGIIYYENWKFVIGSEVDDQNCFIKVYYKNELIENATSYFYATCENDINLDCLNGLEHLTTIMMRIELLYNNLKALDDNKLVRKK